MIGIIANVKFDSIHSIYVLNGLLVTWHNSETLPKAASELFKFRLKMAWSSTADTHTLLYFGEGSFVSNDHYCNNMILCNDDAFMQ